MSSSRRSYSSPRRQRQAEATRHAIAEAARSLFVERGWAATQLRDVAALADVAESTVYAVYGSKAGLAFALVDAADAAADYLELVAELEEAANDPSTQLGVLSRFDRRLFERNGALITLLQDAGRTEPSLKGAYDEGRRRAWRLRSDVFGNWPDGTLRRQLTVKLAADISTVVCSFDNYRELTTEHGWTPDEVERWWHQAQITLLLADHS